MEINARVTATGYSQVSVLAVQPKSAGTGDGKDPSFDVLWDYEEGDAYGKEQACGEDNSTFGSWNALKTMIDPAGGLEFDSLEDAASKKMNWDSALMRSSVALEKKMTGETLSAAELLQMLREAYGKANTEDEEKDWRTMSEEEWEKLLGAVDKQ